METLEHTLATLIQDIETCTDVETPLWREALESSRVALEAAFDAGADGATLVYARARIVDAILTRLWHLRLRDDADRLCLIAVGGYGRGELHPGSDVDIGVLVPETPFDEDALSGFLTGLWDIGLDMGSSVRSIAETQAQAAGDITIMTNLLESRSLAGDPDLFQALGQALQEPTLWPSEPFFRAKFEEQQERRSKFFDSAGRLEPNVKESPGGLRDLQTIRWIAVRHFGGEALDELVLHRLLSADEVSTLRECREFLWRVRFALHRLTKRGDDRLLFDHQRHLAQAFSAEGETENSAVEQFMQTYFRVVTQVTRLNEMLLQLFREEFINPQAGQIEIIDKRFQIQNGYIEARHDDVFNRYPPALLEIFTVGAKHANVKGIRAGTIRLIQQNLHLIDANFREELQARRAFIDLFRQPHGLTHQLDRMNRLGVLAAYLPNFERIVGLMQFDMFHIYTVDQHTLMVVRNLRQFAVPEHAHTHPLCSEVFTEIPKPHVLYLMGLFHDIAKGRGGAHEVLGAVDTRDFCEHHGLPEEDTALAEWGVRNHLLMSLVAQRRDIHDPDVIHDFAAEVGSLNRLNHLYLLTVADICGTDPELWTDWKSMLITQLYQLTRHALEAGLSAVPDASEIAAVRQQEALALAKSLPGKNETARLEHLHSLLGEEYFLRFTAEEIAWHAETLDLLESAQDEQILIRTAAESTEVAVYAADHSMLFANLTGLMCQLGLDVLNARIMTTHTGFAFDVFNVVDQNGHGLDSTMAEQVRQTLARHKDPIESLSGNIATRKMRAFSLKPTVTFDTEGSRTTTSVLITATDHPGLLYQIGKSFVQHGCRLYAAKIATFGEKAEDVFYITDDKGNAVSDSEQLAALRDTLLHNLSTELTP